MEQQELDDSAFRDLRKHLLTSKGGHYGLAKLPNGTIDLSRRSWLDPEMYHHLMVFARQYVTIPFTSMFIGDDLKKIKREGKMYVVSFGYHTGGELMVGTQTVFTNRRPHIIDVTAYSPLPHIGVRHYLCYYTLARDQSSVQKTLNDYEAVYKDSKYKIACWTEGEACRYVSKEEPLWKPMKRSKTAFAPADDFVPNMNFTPAQNLLLRFQTVSHSEP